MSLLTITHESKPTEPDSGERRDMQHRRIIRKSLQTIAQTVIASTFIQIYQKECALTNMEFHLTRLSTVIISKEGIKPENHNITHRGKSELFFPFEDFFARKV